MDLFAPRRAEAAGLTLRPLTMRSYALWRTALPVLELRLSGLPARFALLPWAGAVFALDLEAAARGQSGGMLRAVLEVLGASVEGETLSALRLYVSRSDRTRLTGLELRLRAGREDDKKPGPEDPVQSPDGAAAGLDGKSGVQSPGPEEGPPGERVLLLSLRDLDRIRAALCRLNGAAVPDEAENPELLQAQRDAAAARSVALVPRVEDLVDSVALASGLRAGELADWTVAEFERRRRTVDRARRYTVNALIEGWGGRWKQGNPVPSWCLDRAGDPLGGFTPLGDLMARLGTTEAGLEAMMARAP